MTGGGLVSILIQLSLCFSVMTKLISQYKSRDWNRCCDAVILICFTLPYIET